METVTLILPLEVMTVNNTSDRRSDSGVKAGVKAGVQAGVTVDQQQER